MWPANWLWPKDWLVNHFSDRGVGWFHRYSGMGRHPHGPHGRLYLWQTGTRDELWNDRAAQAQEDEQHSQIYLSPLQNVSTRDSRGQHLVRRMSAEIRTCRVKPQNWKCTFKSRHWMCTFKNMWYFRTERSSLYWIRRTNMIEKPHHCYQ